MKRRTKSLSSKRKYDPAEEPCKEVVKARSGGMCEICGIRPGQSVHHRRKQSQQGPWSPSNTLHLCGMGDGSDPTACHDKVSNTRGEYYAFGWLVADAGQRDKEPWKDKPVWLCVNGWHQWVRLTDDGQRLPLSPDEVLDLGVKVA